jgi:hypothetical protein
MTPPNDAMLLPPEVQALVDEALASTAGDVEAAIHLAMRRVVEDDATAAARGAWVRWLRPTARHRRRAP